MSFQIHALMMAPFKYLFEMTQSRLAEHSAIRVVADNKPGFPCRVSLQDASLGEQLILLNYQHLAGSSPFAAAHAIYVREEAQQAHPEPGEVPLVIRQRLISMRGFDDQNMMHCADVAEGADIALKIDEMFCDPTVDFVDLHNAKQGCFAARATRA